MSVFLSLAACGTLSLVSPRRPASEAPIAIDQSLSADLGTIKDVLERRIAPLDRELTTFHYEKESDSEFMPTSLQDAQARIAGWTDTFFDLSFTKGMSYEFGPGEYVAVDPFASRDMFGDTRPQLYTFNLARGTRVFNSARPYDAREKVALEDIFNRRQCLGTTTVYPEDVFFLLGDMRRSGKEDCMRLIIRAFQDLNVESVLYEFPGATTLDRCDVARGAALVVIRSRAIRFNQFAYYDNHQKFEASPMGTEVSTLYHEASRDPGFELAAWRSFVHR